MLASPSPIDGFHLTSQQPFSIFEFPIIHLACPQILHKPLFSNALGNMQCPQEHLKTIIYAKFGGQTKCIMGNSKIENVAAQNNREKSLLGNFSLL